MSQQQEQPQDPVSVKSQRKIKRLYLMFLVLIIVSVIISVIITKFISPIVRLLQSAGIISFISLASVHWIIAVSVSVILVIHFVAIRVVTWVQRKHGLIWESLASILLNPFTQIMTRTVIIALFIVSVLWPLSAGNVLPHSWFDFFYALFSVLLGMLTLLGLIIAALSFIIAILSMNPNTSGTSVSPSGPPVASLSPVTLSFPVEKEQQTTTPSQSVLKDFAISYCESDKKPAIHITQVLEGAGCTTVRWLWNDPSGSDLASAAEKAARIMLILSPEYLEHLNNLPDDWPANLEPGQLLQVIVRHCQENQIRGVLKIIPRIDLVGLTSNEAAFRKELLKGIHCDVHNK